MLTAPEMIAMYQKQHGKQPPAQWLAVNARQDPDVAVELSGLIGAKDTGHAVMEPLPFDTTQITSKANFSNSQAGDPCHPLAAGAHPPAIVSSAVRRLTPRECERLQGFPDDWTLIPWRGKPAADGPRYKAIGNSMAVPVMHWIGERINNVALT